MNYKDVLLTLDETADGQGLSGLAACLCRTWQAHLTVTVFLAEPFLPPMLGASVPGDILEAQAAAGRARAEAGLASVAKACERLGVPVETRIETGTIDSMPARLARMARHADLTVIGQPDPAASGVDAALMVEAAFLDSGRPALVVPYIGAPAESPSRVLVCWDGSREAARAIGDGLPFLRTARDVTVLVVDAASLQPAVGPIPGADIARHLARHGVSADVRTVDRAGLSVGDAILAEATDSSADLIVMGGFGHSRLRELVLGGTTRHLLEHMTVPVLLAH